MENYNAGDSGETEQDNVDAILVEEDVAAPTESCKSRNKRTVVNGGKTYTADLTRTGPVCVSDETIKGLKSYA